MCDFRITVVIFKLKQGGETFFFFWAWVFFPHSLEKKERGESPFFQVVSVYSPRVFGGISFVFNLDFVFYFFLFLKY